MINHLATCCALTLSCVAFAAEPAAEVSQKELAKVAAKMATVKVLSGSTQTVTQCPLDIIIQNTTKEPYSIYQLGGLPDCTMSVIHSDGRECKFTDNGRILFGTNRDPVSGRMIRIDAGGSHKWRLDLVTFCELTPDTYTVIINVELPQVEPDNPKSWEKGMLRIESLMVIR